MEISNQPNNCSPYYRFGFYTIPLVGLTVSGKCVSTTVQAVYVTFFMRNQFRADTLTVSCR